MSDENIPYLSLVDLVSMGLTIAQSVDSIERTSRGSVAGAV